MTSFTTTAINEDNSKDFKIIKDLIKQNNIETALDIGACIGSFTTFLAKHCKRVYAFEPSPYNFEKLEQNTKHLTNVFLYNVAISDHDADDSILYLCPNDIGMNRLYYSQWCLKGELIRNVKTFSIDSLGLPEPKKIDFVKIDVEGYEYFVLMGMRELLMKDHPKIMMEFHPPSIQEAGSDPEEIIDRLINIHNYNHPLNCLTGEIIHSYEELDTQTRNTPAVNLLFI